MEVIVHGAGQEVGRSCIEVSSNNRRFLFDAGLKLNSDDDEGPSMPLELKDVSFVQNLFLSHVHLDHAGYLPNIYAQGFKGAIYASHFTKKMLPLLLKDSWKIAMIEKRSPGYRRFDMKQVVDLTIEPKEDTRGNSEFDITGAKVKMINAGHIPGARMIQLDFGNESVLYTGDFTLIETRLVPAADLENIPSSDILITESTYGQRDHPNRLEEEKRFLDSINETLAKDGSVILPTFSIGRSQEMIMFLEEYGFTSKYPVYFDGMGKRVAKELTEIENPLLHDALKKVIQVESNDERHNAKRHQCIIVTTSGMLDGGPVCEYLKLFHKSKESSVFLTGYQAEGTNGRSLLARQEVEIDGHTIKVDCNVDKFDFSTHAGFSDLKKVIAKVNPKHIVFVHGDEKALSDLQSYAKSQNIDSYAPKIGEKLTLT